MTPDERLAALAEEVEDSLQSVFRGFEKTAERNTKRVLDAFHAERVSDACFAGTSGYGYDDLGRDTLDRVYARVFGAESALTRIGFVNGTHAIVSALFASVGPGDTLLSLTGAPYDTLRGAIGTETAERGSLCWYGVRFAQVELASDGGPDYDAIAAAAKRKPAAAFIQRSRGYGLRRALTVTEIGKIVETVKGESPDTVIVVDNCYGEFCGKWNPAQWAPTLWPAA
jgi:cystathionine beta-lyase family protein involved in aluminum resistance